MAEKQVEREGMERLERLATRQTAILKTLIDISRIITTSHDLQETLEHTVELVAESLNVDVCSIYIHDADTDQLELRATHGLRRDAVGRVTMPTGEGLIGAVFETKRHLNVSDVSEHPRFKYFPGIDEERLSSFLGVPLIEFRNTLGVLVAQNQENRRFTHEEENLLITIASQISGLVSKALLVDRLQQEAEHPQPKNRPSDAFQLEGVAIAPGLSMGPAVFMRRGRVEEPPYDGRARARGRTGGAAAGHRRVGAGDHRADPGGQHPRQRAGGGDLPRPPAVPGGPHVHRAHSRPY